MNQKIDGNDLMLFLGNKSIAFATNHTLMVQVETVDITSKQSGGHYRSIKPRLISWQITSENVYTEEDANDLLARLVNGQQINCIFGRKSSSADTLDDADLDYWSPKSVGYWKGKAYITSIQVNSPTGEKASMSITLDGNGIIERITSLTQLNNDDDTDTEGGEENESGTTENNT